MNRVELKTMLEKLLSRHTDKDHKQIQEILEMLICTEYSTASSRLLRLIKTFTRTTEILERNDFFDWKERRIKYFKRKGYAYQSGMVLFPEEINSLPKKEMLFIDKCEVKKLI